MYPHWLNQLTLHVFVNLLNQNTAIRYSRFSQYLKPYLRSHKRMSLVLPAIIKGLPTLSEIRFVCIVRWVNLLLCLGVKLFTR